MFIRIMLVLCLVMCFGAAAKAQPIGHDVPAKWAEPLQKALDFNSVATAYLTAKKWLKQDQYSELSIRTLTAVYLELGQPAFAYETALAMRMHGDQKAAPLIARCLLADGQPEAAWHAVAKYPQLQSLQDRAYAQSMMQIGYSKMLQRIKQAAKIDSGDSELIELQVLLLSKLGMTQDADQLINEAVDNHTASANILASVLHEQIGDTVQLRPHKMSQNFDQLEALYKDATDKKLDKPLASLLRARIDNLVQIALSNQYSNLELKHRKEYQHVFEQNIADRIQIYRKRLAETVANPMSQTIFDSDWLVVFGQSTLEDWKNRLAVCSLRQYQTEALCALAHLVELTGHPGARGELNRYRRKADKELEQAKLFNEQGDQVEMDKALQRAMRLDPVAHEPLMFGYQAARANDNDVRAGDYLRQLWRNGGRNWWTDVPVQIVRADGMNMAIRAGDWSLLFSLALDGCKDNPGDMECQYNLFLAGLAMGFEQRTEIYQNVRATPFEHQANLAKGFVLPPFKKVKSGYLTLRPFYSRWQYGKTQVVGLDAACVLLSVRTHWHKMNGELKTKHQNYLTRNAPTGTIGTYAQYALGQLNRQKLLNACNNQPSSLIVDALLLLEQANRSETMPVTPILKMQYDPLLPGELKAALHEQLTRFDQTFSAQTLRLEDQMSRLWMDRVYQRRTMPGMDTAVAKYSGLRQQTFGQQAYLLKCKLAIATSDPMRADAVSRYASQIEVIGKARKLTLEQIEQKRADVILSIIRSNPSYPIYKMFATITKSNDRLKKYIAQLTRKERQLLKQSAQKVVRDYEGSHVFGKEIYKTYPPGSEYYNVVVASMRNGDSISELKAKVNAAYQKKRAAWDAAESRRKEKLRIPRQYRHKFNTVAEYVVWQKQYNKWGYEERARITSGYYNQRSAQSTSRSYRSSRSSSNSYYNQTRKTPSWKSTWSSSYQTQVYRNQINQQINRAMGGY